MNRIQKSAFVLAIVMTLGCSFLKPPEGSATSPRPFWEEAKALPLDANFSETPFPSFGEPADEAELQLKIINAEKKEGMMSLVLDGRPLGYGVTFSPTYIAVTRLSGDNYAGVRVVFQSPVGVLDLGSAGAVEVSQIDSNRLPVGACYRFSFNGFELPCSIEGYTPEGEHYGNLLRMTGGSELFNFSGFEKKIYENFKMVGQERSEDQHKLAGGETFRWYKTTEGVRNDVVAWEQKEGGRKRGLCVTRNLLKGQVAYFGVNGRVEGDVITLSNLGNDTVEIVISPVNDNLQSHGSGWRYVVGEEISLSYGQFSNGKEVGERKVFKLQR